MTPIAFAVACLLGWFGVFGPYMLGTYLVDKYEAEGRTRAVSVTVYVCAGWYIAVFLLFVVACASP